MNGRKNTRGFILLEVLVALVILAIAMTALMRGFVISLNSIQKVTRNEQAIYLAKSLLDDLILEPPADGKYEGNFGDDPRYGEEFANWKWEIDVEADEPRYEVRPEGTMLQDLEEVYTAKIEIINIRNEEDIVLLSFSTYLLEPELFSKDAIETNQLF